MSGHRQPHVRWLGTHGYTDVLAAMKAFTLGRGPRTPDELWVVEHPPVYTLGINGGREHVLDARTIPVVPTDRGGQVTYHGPGQLVVYPLLDLARSGLRMRRLIEALEEAAIATLAHCGIAAAPGDAPGVFVGARKIASIGLRMASRCSYHGMALNVCNDLRPFRGIDPCGQPGLAMTSVAEQGGPADVHAIADLLLPELIVALTRRATAPAARPLAPQETS